MKRATRRSLAGRDARYAQNGGGRHTGATSGVVKLTWLPGAGHTMWVSDWPDAIRSECEAIIGALRPRCSVEIYVPDLNYAGRPIDAKRFADELRREITRVTGGQTSYRTEGDFSPPGHVGMVENTLVIKTLLPTVVNDAMRLWVVALLVGFGLDAGQDVVQVEIESRGYWVHTGLLRGEALATNGRVQHVSLPRPKAAARPAASRAANRRERPREDHPSPPESPRS